MKKLLLILVLALTTVAHAQSTGLSDSDVVLTITPENPAPNETVTAQLQSYSADLDQLPIMWTYDNKTVSSGTGKTSVQVTAGDIGTAKVLTAVIRTDTTTTIQKTVTISPGGLELLWEAADAYTPPFYKGKALPGPEGMIRITAFPENSKLAKSATYAWSRNDTPDQANSGYGKNSFIYRDSYLNQGETIAASMRRGTASTTDAITVFSTQPFTALYQRISGFIDYANAITDSHSMSQDNEVFVAEPYYFSVPASLEKDLTFEWTLGGTPADAGDRANEVVISRGSSTGQTDVSVSVKNENRILQFADKKFNLIF